LALDSEVVAAMDTNLRVLHVDAASGFYRIERFPVGRFFGPVDLGLHLASEHDSLNIGTGLLCGSIFPGSNRLIFTGRSPCWQGFFISSMGGAGLVFDNLGLNMLAIRGRAPQPSLLYLNRSHGEEIEVELSPIDPDQVWRGGRGGVYAVIDTAYARFADRYQEDPRVLAVGPAARATDMGAIVSVPINKGEITFVDTWAGRGGFGSKLFQQHGLVGVIYGGTYVDEDFRDRKVADEWFEQRYQQKMVAKQMEATTKYRHDPEIGSGGTFGANYARMGDRLLAFNYRSIDAAPDARRSLHQELVVEHYLRQFNEEVIAAPRSQSFKNCGEPCLAVCKKMYGEYKKDYEPYQTLGPLAGVFDQRAAERLNRAADTHGFDGISGGGVVAWLLDCLDTGLLTPDELGVSGKPVFSREGFDVVGDSARNAALGVEILDGIVARRGLLDFFAGPRVWARRLGGERGAALRDRFVFISNGSRGWMVPNQYWTPGVLSPMPIMGKYYMYYGEAFLPPRQLGRRNAERLVQELMLDNVGFCRFHRGWAEDMVPEIIGQLFGKKNEFIAATRDLARRIGSRNSTVFWESRRNIDFTATALRRMREVSGCQDAELSGWLDRFAREPGAAAIDFWFEIRKGVDETLSRISDL
jgi:glyceraldehyde-3-phosphate dehydrogenase (ferredoxin)